MTLDFCEFYQLGIKETLAADEKPRFTKSVDLISFAYLLGQMMRKSQEKKQDTKHKLLTEILHNFENFSYLPNLVNVHLKEVYSNRLLQKTFNSLGYQVPTQFRMEDEDRPVTKNDFMVWFRK